MELKKTILLTGITGFLGSNLAKKLIDNNYRIIALKRSFSDTFRLVGYTDKIIFYDIDKIQLKNIFDENKLDMVVHCATNYGRKTSNPIETIDANLILPLNLLHLASEYQIPSFINTDTILDKRVNTYSLSKKQFLDWLQTYSNRLKCINVSLEHFYGPFDDKSKFVAQIINEILTNKTEIKLTKGEQKRDFIYIDDVTDAFMAIITNIDKINVNYTNFEVGYGTSISIQELVSLIKKIANNNTTSLNFGAIPYRENEIMESHANIKKLVDLGWKPKFTISEGLEKTIELERSKL